MDVGWWWVEVATSTGAAVAVADGGQQFGRDGRLEQKSLRLREGEREREKGEARRRG